MSNYLEPTNYFTDEEWSAYDQWCIEQEAARAEAEYEAYLDQQQTAHDEYLDSMEYWNPVEQGYYDEPDFF